MRGQNVENDGYRGESIGGAEFDAMIEKLNFLFDLGLLHFSKIAVVTHKKWIHHLADLEGKLFKNMDMRGFSIEEKKSH